MKSTKEPKESKKASAKPRKTSAKAKPQAAVEPASQIMDEAASAQAPVLEPADTVNGSSNGATAVASLAAPETGNGADMEVSGDGQFTAEADPPRELIEVRAYELFVQRGYEHGHHDEDWITAERELKSRHRNA